MTSKEHKIIAKEALNGNWGLAIGLLAVSIFLPLIIAFVPFLGAIAILIFAPAIAYIPLQLFLKLKRKEEVHIKDFFNYTFSHRLGKFWLTSLYVGLIIFGVAFISLILANLLSRLLFNISELVGNIGTIILTLLTYALIYYFSFKYSQVAYIMHDNPELKCREIANKSAELMKGNMLKFLWLFISFIGWLILAVFTLGLAYIYVLPYLYATLASFYDSLLENTTSNTNDEDEVVEV